MLPFEPFVWTYQSRLGEKGATEREGTRVESRGATFVPTEQHLCRRAGRAMNCTTTNRWALNT